MKKSLSIALLSVVSIALLGAAPSATPSLALGASPSVSLGAQASAASPGETQVLRLRSGDILWGQVVEHDAGTLRFRRIDTGGIVSLPWSFLDPVEEAERRLEFGYVELAAEELLVDAERFTLRDGSELMGVLDGRDTRFIWIKNADGRIPIPVQNIQGAPERVRVAALEVYSRQELYQAKSAELGAALVASGRTGAVAHDELAKYSERLFDYVHAYEHYSYVDQLDPSYDSQRIGSALERAKLKAEQQEQLDVLSAIDLHSARGRFDRALAALALFEERYPDSPLREDWIKLRDRVKKAQLSAVREAVRRSVYSWTTRLAREAVRKHTEYSSLVAYLEDDMQEALFEAVRGDLARLAPGIEEGEIKQIWLERKLAGARPATFGVGTWLLGKERANKTYAKEKDKEKEGEGDKQPSKADARKQLDERLEAYIKNQQLTRKAQSRGSSDEEDENQKFWELWNYSSRWHWAQAYFIEDSELFSVTSVSYTACRECGGKGILEILNLGGASKNSKRGNVATPCPTCHTLGIVRRIRYR